ncbi:YdcF family protein [Acidipropionibacterium acidipropionici]|nr:YdcF family protein [Acidipropionibacterium acidipropionici]
MLTVMTGALITVVLLVGYALLARWRPGAWTNGLVLLCAVLAAAWVVVRQAVGIPVFGIVVLALLAVGGVLGVLALPLLLIANGVTMARKEGLRPANMLSGLLGVAILGLMVWLAVSIGQQLTGPLYLGIGAFLALAWLSFGYLGFLASGVALGRSRCAPGRHHLVVLGAGLINGRVPRLLGGRLDRAVDQWRADRAAGYESLIIPSGGQGSDESRAEGDAMAEYLREHGVPEAAIRIEDRATTTAENLRYSTELVAREEPAGLVVVTSSYHAVRAADLCRRRRLRAQVLGASTARYFMPSALLREYVALLAVHPWLNAVMVALTFSTGPLAWWLSSMS